jgi:acyl-CoA reductase-like NAD-dependent aldehyde dehydrogenase
LTAASPPPTRGDRDQSRGAAPHLPSTTRSSDCAEGDRAAREEILGLVVCVLPFKREDKVIARSNDTQYGLAGSTWAADGARALRVARGLQAGALAVTSYTSVRLGTPFGGFKQSGLGRELGADAPDAYTELKNVFYATEA